MREEDSADCATAGDWKGTVRLCHTAPRRFPTPALFMTDDHSVRAIVACLAAALLCACAPDALNNRAATGFDGFLNRIQRACAPIQLGDSQLAHPLMGGVTPEKYDYWLDQTSGLYYRRISTAQYRQSINAFFDGGNDATIDCIVGNLPPG
jgi:hypothetical protein